MSRASTVATHPQRARIESMLDDGVSYADIVRTYPVLSLASVGRFALSRRSELAKIASDEPGVTDVLSRLVQIADHAQEIRRHMKVAGTPVAQSRAIKTESEILTKLLTELGVDDVTVLDALTESQSLIGGFKVFLRSFPESAHDLLNVFADIPELAQLAQTLRRAGIGKTA